MKKKIALWVWGLHIFWVAILCFIAPSSPVIKRQLVVRTHTEEKKPTVAPRSVAASMKKKAPESASPPPQTKAPEVAKRPSKTPPSASQNPLKNKAKSAPSKASPTPPAPQKKMPSFEISQDLAQQLEESIAKIEQKQDNLWIGKQQLPKPALEPVHIDVSAYTEDATSFGESAVAYLQERLQLPDCGDVRVEITIATNGRVVRMVVLESESEKNKRYLEKQLPLVRFPVLHKEESLVLTFCTRIR